MDKQGKIKLGITFIVLIGIFSLCFVFAEEEQTEKIEHNRKIIENDGVSISAKIVEHCSWKPDSINDGYKICEVIIEGYNPNNYTLTVDKPGEGHASYFNLDKADVIKNKNYDYYYSYQFELYNETLSNITEFTDDYLHSTDDTIERKRLTDSTDYTIERKRFVNWTSLPKDIKDTPTNNHSYFAYKIVFEFPQYGSAIYNFSINYKKQDDTIPIFLDPDISACGTLSTAGETYTQNESITNNSLTDDCIKITAENITFNGNGFFISSDDNHSGVYSDQLNTTIKNCNISMSTSVGGYGIDLYNANSSYIFNNTLHNQRIGIRNRNSDYVRIENNTFDVYHTYGVVSDTSSYVNITNNILNDGRWGIYYYSVIPYWSLNNYITDNTFNSFDDIALDIYSNKYSVLNNNKMWNCSLRKNTFSTCLLVFDSKDCSFDGNYINKSDKFGIELLGGGINNTFDPANNIFKNTKVENTIEQAVRINAGGTGVQAINNTFLNVTYDTEYTSYGGAGASTELIRKWYFNNVQVNHSETPANFVKNANVTISNITSLIYSGLTNSNGLVSPNLELIEYINNNGIKTYHLLRTINVTHHLYYDISTSYNVSTEKNSYTYPIFLSPISISLSSPVTGEFIPPVEPEIIEIFIEAKGVCGNRLCEPEYGEMFWTCPKDCGGLNLDDLILSCFDDDPEINQKCITKQAPVVFWIAIVLIFVTTIAMVGKVPGVKKYQAKIFQIPKSKSKKKPTASSWLKRQQNFIKKWQR